MPPTRQQLTCEANGDVPRGSGLSVPHSGKGERLKGDIADNRGDKRRVDDVYYRDFSNVTANVGIGASGDANARGDCATSDHSNAFPSKLYDILSNPEFSNIVTWMSHGRSWRIEDIKRFQREVMPKYFKTRAHSSFMRLVSSWGFRRKTSGTDQNSYYHEYFLRGLPHLHKKMYRVKPNSKRIKIDPGQEPDFYSTSQSNPLPELQQFTNAQNEARVAFDNAQNEARVAFDNAQNEARVAFNNGLPYRVGGEMALNESTPYFYSAVDDSNDANDACGRRIVDTIAAQSGLPLPGPLTNNPSMLVSDGVLLGTMPSSIVPLSRPEYFSQGLGHALNPPNTSESRRATDIAIALETNRLVNIPYSTAPTYQQSIPILTDVNLANGALTSSYFNGSVLSGPIQDRIVTPEELYVLSGPTQDRRLTPEELYEILPRNHLFR